MKNLIYYHEQQQDLHEVKVISACKEHTTFYRKVE